MSVLITDIAGSVKAGDNDAALDAVIQQYLTDWELTETVAEWRLANYADLRRWAYPPQQAYFDEVVIGDMSGGYIEDCTIVNSRFPQYPANSASVAGGIPAFVVADSTDTVSITNIPNPSTIIISSHSASFTYDEVTYPPANIHPDAGISWEVTTGTFIIMVDTPGWYLINIYSAGYEQADFFVLATEP